MSEAATITPNDMPGAPTPNSPDSPPTENTSTESASTGDGLTADERAELDRLRGVHKDEQKWRREATANYSDAEKYRKLLEQLGGNSKDKQFDPQAAITELTAKFEQAEQARIRAEVARTEDVDPTVLRGATEDEMRTSAQQFKRLVEAAVEKKANGIKPAAAPASEVTSNGKVKGPQQIVDRSQLQTMTAKQIIEAREAGLLDELQSGAST